MNANESARSIDAVAAPPFGMRPGITPILILVSLILHSEEIALYEHGTFKPALTEEICERLIRNPANFEIKHFASRTGDRAELLTEVANGLEIGAHRRPRNGMVGSVLGVLSHLVSLMNVLPDHVKVTTFVSPDAKAIRGVLLTATEPDELLFHSLPQALGRDPVGTKGGYDKTALREIADRLSTAVLELQRAYPALLAEIRDTLREQFRGPDERLRESLAARARDMRGKVVDPALARLVVSLTADIPGDDEWAEYVAMNVTGTPPVTWSDDDRRRFFSAIHDVGGTFRRIEALNADMRSRGDSFDAIRVTVTRPDGVEAAKLVWVDEARRSALEPIVETAVEKAREHVSSGTEARDLLMAMLAEGDLMAEEGPSGKIAAEPSAGAEIEQHRKGTVGK